MWSYVVRGDGETLERFVRRHYHVTGADGEPDRLRLRLVYDTFEWVLADRVDIQWVEWGDEEDLGKAGPPKGDERNPGMTGLPKGAKIPLLDVPGVPKRDVVTRPLARRNLKYAVVWLIGLLLGSALNTALRLGLPWLAQQLIRLGAPVMDLPVQLLRDVTGLSTAAGTGWAWPTRWTLLVIGIWVYNYPSPASPYARARLRYALVWLAGLVVLAYASSSIWDNLPVGLTSVLWPLDGAFVLVAVWSLCVFNVYVVRGDDSDGYREFVAPYRGIWISLSLVLLGIALASYANYQSIARRVDGLMSSRTLAGQSASAALRGIGDTQIYAQRLLQGYQALEIAATPEQNQAGLASVQVPSDLLAVIRADWLGLRQASAIAEAAAEAAAADVDEAIRAEQRAVLGAAEREAGRSAGSTPLATPAVTSTTGVTLALGTSLLGTRYALTAAVSETARIAATVDDLVRRYSPLAPTGSTATRAEVIELRTRLATEVLGPAQIAYPRVERANDGLEAVGPNVLPVVVGTAALLAAFVLLPWVLLVVFLFRKRRDRAAEILRDLRRLDPTKGLLKRTLGITGRTDGARSAATAGDRPGASERSAAGDQPATGDPAGAGQQPTAGRPEKSMSPEAQQFFLLSRSVDALPGPRQETLLLTEDNMKHLTRVVNNLASRTFNSAEYVLCLGLLSVLVSVGWYFVLYPQTSVGLALLIVRGADVLRFTDMIWQNLTPVTAGFLGAYFFVIYQLVNRYLAADLYPAAFLQAAERFAIVFILSLMLWVVVMAGDVAGDAVSGLSTTAAEAMVGTAYLVAIGLAFVAGIWPREGLRQIIERVQALGRTRLALGEQTTPLTQLEGLTIWDESRLREEKVSDVQSLATTSVGDLVVNTHYPATQLVDWIDQAILYVHAGQNGELYPAFRWVGIRTATDLLDAVGYPLLRGSESFHESYLDDPDVDPAPRPTPGARGTTSSLPEYRDREFAPLPRRVDALCEAIKAAAAAHKGLPAADAPVTDALAADDPSRRNATIQIAARITPDWIKLVVDAILPDQNIDLVLNWYAWLGEAPPE